MFKASKKNIQKSKKDIGAINLIKKINYKKKLKKL